MVRVFSPHAVEAMPSDPLKDSRTRVVALVIKVAVAAGISTPVSSAQQQSAPVMTTAVVTEQISIRVCAM